MDGSDASAWKGGEGASAARSVLQQAPQGSAFSVGALADASVAGRGYRYVLQFFEIVRSWELLDCTWCQKAGTKVAGAQ